MVTLDLLPGIIWSFAIGLAAGNYACTFIYRLPRSLPVVFDSPYCGACKTRLKPGDLFPLFSWLLLKGRCRYCNADIPVLYTWVELVVSLIFVICYLQYDFSQTYILIASIQVSLVVFAATGVNNDKVVYSPLYCAAIGGLLLNSLNDGGIYHVIIRSFGVMMLAIIMLRMHGKRKMNDTVSSAYPVWFVMASIILPLREFLIFVLLWCVLALFICNRKWLATTYSMAVGIPLLLPQLANLFYGH